MSYHEGNEAERARELSQRIERGDNVALVSDAGTPAISDPGFRLIRACIDRDLDIEVLPGPSSIITALVVSGLPTHRFRFQGFLPRRTGELERVLQSTETLIAFESPRRLPESLRALAQLAPDRPAPSVASSPSFTRRSGAAPSVSSHGASGMRPGERSSW